MIDTSITNEFTLAIIYGYNDSISWIQSTYCNKRWLYFARPTATETKIKIWIFGKRFCQAFLTKKRAWERCKKYQCYFYWIKLEDVHQILRILQRYKRKRVWDEG